MSKTLRDNQILSQRYLVGKTVGEGAFAKVKYGEHRVTREPVAIKLLSKRRLTRAGLLRDVDREIAVTRRLKHPHIVDVKDVIVNREKICIIMEYVDGGTLFDRIVREGPFQEQAARRVFQQLLGALDYCHSQGVFHRDLKPENVLLSIGGDVKLSDFGLSGFLTDHDGGNGFFDSTCGTPNYTAPEILRQQKYQGAPADIWSLGVVLYVMLVGKLPFMERSLSELCRRIVSGVCKIPRSLSPFAQDLLQKMLQPIPGKRIRLEEIFNHPWITSSTADANKRSGFIACGV